MINVFAISYK